MSSIRLSISEAYSGIPTPIVGDKNLMIESGLKDFALPGLYSIVLKKQGSFKTRLFVFDNNESLGKCLVPLHSHKYIDQFTHLFGSVTDYCYVLNEREGVICDAFNYTRLCDENTQGLVKLNSQKVLKLDEVYTNTSHIIEAQHYHTVAIHKPETAWMISELEFNDLYNPANICFLLPSMNVQSFETTKMNENDFKIVENILNKNGYSLGIF